MAKKKSAKKSPAKAKPRNRHLVSYVENCSRKDRVFSSFKAMDAFIDTFNKKHPKPDKYQDSWIDLVVTDIKGIIVNEQNDAEID
jgi:hypothetical protein